MDAGETRGSTARLIAGLLVELALTPVMLLAVPFGALDQRHGWTRRGRRARARHAMNHGDPVPIERAAGLPRAVLEGVLEPAGPPVRVPLVDVDALAWGVWVERLPGMGFVLGETTAIDLVDPSARARLPLEARDIGWSLAERTHVDDPPAAWCAEAGPKAEGFMLSWLPIGTTVRASGCVRRTISSSAYRGATTPYTLGADLEDTPVLLDHARPRTSHEA